MIVLCACMKRINNELRRTQYELTLPEHFALWQSSTRPVKTHEKAAASRFITQMTWIGRIFTDTYASVKSAFYIIPSAFICVHLRLIFVSLSDRLQKSKFELDPIKPKIEPANNNQAHRCLNLLENKPQINADERRFVNLNIQRLNCLSLSERGEP